MNGQRQRIKVQIPSVFFFFLPFYFFIIPLTEYDVIFVPVYIVRSSIRSTKYTATEGQGQGVVSSSKLGILCAAFSPLHNSPISSRLPLFFLLLYCNQHRISPPACCHHLEHEYTSPNIFIFFLFIHIRFILFVMISSK